MKRLLPLVALLVCVALPNAVLGQDAGGQDVGGQDFGGQVAGGQVVGGQQCGWVAWLQECEGEGLLVRTDTLEEFEEAMTRHGDEGMHLISVAYGAGKWVGFFHQRRGSYRWATRREWSDFEEDAIDWATDNDYDAEALAHGDGHYLGWFRRNPGASSSWSSRTTSDKFKAVLAEKIPGGEYMSAALSTGNDFWVGWFVEKEGASRYSHVRGFPDLTLALQEFRDSNFYVTAMAHGDGDWIVWYEEEEAGGAYSEFTVQPTDEELRGWLVERFKGRCVTALSYGCA